MARRSQLALSSGRNRHDLAENLQAAAEVVTLEGGVGIAAKRGGRFCHLAGFGLDLRFELDCGVGEICALKGFVDGKREDGQQQDVRGCESSANQREHAGTSMPSERGKSERDRET